MAYVTQDPRVQEIVSAYTRGAIARGEAASRIKSLLPQRGAEFGYLDWEVEEALETAE